MAVTRNMDELLSELYWRRHGRACEVTLEQSLLDEAQEAGWVVLQGGKAQLTPKGAALAAVILNRAGD